MFKKYLGLNITVFILFIFFILDLALKFYFIENPTIIIGRDFIFGLVNFHLVKNSGIAFGIVLNQIFLVILIIVIILIMIRVLVKAYFEKNNGLVVGLSFIVVGAISNLIDRIRFGFVVDYIDLKWFTVFNLADTMISVGVVILLIVIYKGKDKKRPARVPVVWQ